MVRPFVQPRATARPMDLFGATITVLLPADAAGGAVSQFEDRGQPGSGPPLHLHHDAEEAFQVLSGRFRFLCGDETVEAGPGDTLLVPRGTPHCFLRLGGGEGALLVTMCPGGFERFFEEVFAAGLAVPQDLDRIAEIGRRHRIEFLGPNPLASA